MRLTLREFPERTVVAVLMGPLDREPSTFVTRRRFTLPSFDEKANGDDERGESRETLMTLLTLQQGKATVDHSLARLLDSSRRSVPPMPCHLMPPHATSCHLMAICAVARVARAARAAGAAFAYAAGAAERVRAAPEHWRWSDVWPLSSPHPAAA